MASDATGKIAVDPFLLPVCHCGGAANLAAVEPDLLRPIELRTYRCTSCGNLATYQRGHASTMTLAPRLKRLEAKPPEAP